MTETPSSSTYVARLITDQMLARDLADYLAEVLDPAKAVCAAFERADRMWQVDIYVSSPPDKAPLQTLIAQYSREAAALRLTVEKIPERDWVKDSLEGLKPVHAGRYVVHGAHDRARIPINRVGIQVEAATAFGTGHHGTTRGCLIALDALARRSRPRRILDLGAGTGVLAIAAAKVWRRNVLATDIDREAVRAARDNARRNAVHAFVQVAHANGLRGPLLNRQSKFDLVLANILLAPLQRMAAPLAQRLAPNGRAVLSGLLESHANAALAAYRVQGLVLERRIRLDGWQTLVMVAKSRPSSG